MLLSQQDFRASTCCTNFSYIDDELGIDLTAICRLDTMVTVVDANRFVHDINSEDLLMDRDQSVDETDERLDC